MAMTTKETVSDIEYSLFAQVGIVRDHLMARQVIDVRAMLAQWLAMAADAQQPDAVRAMVLEEGVTPTLRLFADAASFHGKDCGLGKEFADKSARCLALFIKDENYIVPEQTTGQLLSIAEGAGQASTDVRKAAFVAYKEAVEDFAHLYGHVENEEHLARASAVATEFSPVKTWRAEINEQGEKLAAMIAARPAYRL